MQESTTKNNIFYDASTIQELIKNSRKNLDKTIKLVVLGPAKGGKSTLLRNLTRMNGLFLSGIELETTNFWRFKVSNERMEKSIIFKEINEVGE